MVFDLKDLMLRGYLPRELPPLVSSKTFSEYADTSRVSFPATKETEGTRHNLRRAGGARRALTIPHPLAYLELGRSIERNWPLLDAVFSKSPFLASIPTFNTSQSGRSFVPSFYFSQRPRARAQCAIRARFVLVGDLSQCYSSIYTHSIPWALEGKAVSKGKVRAGRVSTIVGNEIDVRSQRIQLRQTKGIPIGPDSSFILGELMLSSIDQRMCGELSRNGSTRHTQSALRITDDFEYYASTRGEAENVWLEWEKAANYFELHVNPSKTEIRELPESFESNWAIVLSQMPIQRRSVDALVKYFSAVRELARDHRESGVFAFAIQRVNRYDWVFDNDATWSVYSDLILTSIITEPSAMKIGAVAFERADLQGRMLNVETMEVTLNELAAFHSELEHGSEVCWSLYLLKRFGLKLQSETAQKIADMDDNLSLLLIHHLADISLIDGADPDFSSFESRAESYDALSTSDWLLAYESVAQGWVTPSAFASEPQMQAMMNAGVSFLEFGPTGVVPSSPTVSGSGSTDESIDWTDLLSRSNAFSSDLMASMIEL